MPQIISQFERARHLISQPPDKRMEHEIMQLVPWLRSKAQLFKQLKAELLADIMRNCNIETKERDDVIIKQGDTGECFYIVLSGKVSIYIVNKDDFEGLEEEDIFENLIHYNDKGKLDRERLGYMVTHLGTGAPFGEVALMSDSVRTASIVAEEKTDLLVVDRKLYNRSIKDVLAQEFREKTEFIASNPLFCNWAPKYRKHLAMAMYKETYGYETPLVRQGDRTAGMYFILSGQVEIQVDPSTHPHQYPRIFKAARENEVEKLIKKATAQGKPKRSKGGANRHDNSGMEPHLPLHNGHIKKRDATKCTRLCHLGVNEAVGDLELTLDLPTYMQTAVCTETTSVLVLEHRHYVRLFVRRHPRSIDKMRDEIGVKLESRLSLLSLKPEIPFLQYVCQIIASQNVPPPPTETEHETYTVFSANKEFLNHKGPLIDLYGPGSVFFLINLREKTKMRLKAKRGGPSDRQMMMNQKGRPKSYRDMQLLTQLMEATKEIEGEVEDEGNTTNREQISSDDDREGRRRGGAGDRSRTGSGDDYIGDGSYDPEEELLFDDGHAYLEQMDRQEGQLVQQSYQHQQNHHQQHQQQQLQLQQDHLLHQRQSRSKSLSRSSEQTSPRPGTGWMSQLHHLSDSVMESPEVHDARLSTLEERLRHFLETGNPKGRPHVTQLRRLAVQDMEFQPKPGNKVVVRRRDPQNASPSGSYHGAMTARFMTRPPRSANENSRRFDRQKATL